MNFNKYFRMKKEILNSFKWLHDCLMVNDGTSRIFGTLKNGMEIKMRDYLMN